MLPELLITIFTITDDEEILTRHGIYGCLFLAYSL